MIIIAGYTVVAASERDRVVSTFADLVTRVRAVDGCLDAAITADQVDARRIYNLEVWRDAEALDAWRARPTLPTRGWRSSRSTWRATTPLTAARCSPDRACSREP